MRELVNVYAIQPMTQERYGMREPSFWDKKNP